MTRRTVETDEYVAFAKRALVALAMRAGAEDEIELRMLMDVVKFAEECEAQAVARQRARGISWPRIALATGRTWQAAQKRWQNARVKLYTNREGWH